MTITSRQSVDQSIASRSLGVVLAGGRSSRMGQDKALLPIGNQTYLSRAVSLLAQHCAQVLVSGHYPDYTWVADGDEGGPFQGPLAGIARCAEYGEAHQFEALVVIPVDMPLLEHRELAFLIAAATQAPRRPHGLGGAYFPLYLPLTDELISAISRLRAAPNGRDRSVRALLQQTDARLHDYADRDTLFNVNTPADHSQLQQIKVNKP